MFLLSLLACGPPPLDAPPSARSSTPIFNELPPVPFSVRVRLDGAPIEGAWVSVGGGMQTTTDANGRATIDLGDGNTVIVSHPEARTVARTLPDPDEQIELQRFSRTDNLDYVYQDPGVPGELGNTSQCGHCHGSMVTDWADSPHRDAASNPVVHDVFSGVSGHSDAASCTAAGGSWRLGLEPGTRASVQRCYLGFGTLSDLNPGCGVDCDTVATDTGGCAACHAPGIDGELQGRSLLEATGRSFEEGIHCDVCHKVESVNLGAAPGVEGALRILRPSEPSTSITEDFKALTFGPFPDVPNPRMGSVQRDHFRQSEFCAGCHELVQDAQIPGQAIDSARWPDGLPVHSTWSEWQLGPYAPQATCQSCHMPPDPRWLNAWDYTIDGLAPSVATGWPRPPGAVRRHSFDGPRGAALLPLAADVQLRTERIGTELTVTATTRNVGAGHAIPTGEPFRSMYLVLAATCTGTPLLATAGDVVPAFAGALDTRESGWDVWPGAQVGQRIRVVRRVGDRDYQGPGRFSNDFAPAEKGIPLEVFVDEAEIVSVDGDVVILDHLLAAGDVAYRVDGAGLPDDGEASRAWAGAPGFAFARVLIDADGNQHVPHHRAVDILSDNRILPGQGFVSTHVFESPCADPVVTARLMYRPYPLQLAKERGWSNQDRLMVEVSR